MANCICNFIALLYTNMPNITSALQEHYQFVKYLYTVFICYMEKHKLLFFPHWKLFCTLAQLVVFNCLRVFHWTLNHIFFSFFFWFVFVKCADFILIVSQNILLRVYYSLIYSLFRHVSQTEMTCFARISMTQHIFNIFTTTFMAHRCPISQPGHFESQ